MDSGLRRCGRCRRRRPANEFNWRNKAHTRRQSYCRECGNQAWREWYRSEPNRKRHLEQLSRRRIRRIERNRRLVRWLKSAPCTDCQGVYPSHVMDFDHIESKSREIPYLVYSSSTETLIEELKKCQVVCANCHRQRTERRRTTQSGDGTEGEA